MNETITTNANAAVTLTPEQLAALPPELAAVMAAMQEQLAATQAALIAAQTRKTRKTSAPVDPWSNSQLLVYGNDHSRVIAALSLLIRAGRKEADITQQDLTRATLALQFVTRGWREGGRCAMAEASIRTAVGQCRLWRELCDTEKLAKNCHRLELDDFEQRIFNFYCQHSFWPGEKEDPNKRFSPTAAALLMATWREKTAENPDWYPPEYSGTVEEQPEDDDPESDNDNGDSDNGDSDNDSPESESNGEGEV